MASLWDSQTRRQCRLCHEFREMETVCSSCGGIDHLVPLSEFVGLRSVDGAQLSQIALRLRSIPEDDESLILHICAELSLGRLDAALRLLRRAARRGLAQPRLHSLLNEVAERCRSEDLARSLLARERGELGHRKIILSVDDSATVRRVLEIAFAREGHVVVSVVDAEEALTALSELRPDILFVDFQLPGLDGLALCRRIRKEATTRQVPVVVLSSKVGPGFEDDARRSGANAFLSKPASSEVLLETVRRLAP